MSMGLDKFVWSRDVIELARQLDSIRDEAKGEPFLARKAPSLADPNGGELYLLRRWNSHAPSIEDVEGGGYFFRWKNTGVVVDPGCGFLNQFRKKTTYGPQDIDLVAVTHDHLDHCQDFAALVALLREVNKRGLRKREAGFPRTLDLILSHGVSAQFASVLTHPDNAPFLRWTRVLPPREIAGPQRLPSIAENDGGRPADLSAWGDGHLRARMEFLGEPMEKKYGFRLQALPANHEELLGEKTALGLRFDFTSGPHPFSIVISGDTGGGPASPDAGGDNGFRSARELAQFYAGADLLILHVGTMEKVDATTGKPQREKFHLGLLGVVEILEELAKISQEGHIELPKMVVLTEWGYEFSWGRAKRRSAFTQCVVEMLDKWGTAGRNKYCAAVGNAPPMTDKTPILPADLSLCIRLPDFHVRSEPSGAFVLPYSIRAHEDQNKIRYL